MKFHRQGVAQELFNIAEKEWISNNIKRVEFTVVSHNKSAIALYKKLGYQVEGERKMSTNLNGTFYDEYYMSKIL